MAASPRYVRRRHLSEAIIVKPESEPHPSTGQPIGRPVDATPARRPGPVTLEGRYGRVEKLGTRHVTDLWEAYAGHDHIWTYLSAYGPFPDAVAFSDWLASRVTLEDPYSLRDRRHVGPRARHRGAARNPSGDARHRGWSRRLFAGPDAHGSRDRSAVSARSLRARNTRLSTLRVEVQRAQCSLAPRGNALRLRLRRHLPPALDSEGSQP